jgi:hypothetical protein
LADISAYPAAANKDDLFWGSVGFVFAGFAPGYLLVVVLNLHRRLPLLAGPFALSLIINCILAEVLVLCGLYTPAMMRPLASIVVLAAGLALLFDDRLSTKRIVGGIGAWLACVDAMGRRKLALATIATTLALVVAYEIALFLMSSSGSILLGYDPVVQWNPWAVDWSQNRFPNRIYHYPQLIPFSGRFRTC